MFRIHILFFMLGAIISMGVPSILSAQEQSKLTSEAWGAFRSLTHQYDSIQAVLKAMQKAYPELKRNPAKLQAQLGNDVQTIVKVYQAIPDAAKEAMNNPVDPETLGQSDLHTLKLAANSTNEYAIAVRANERLLEMTSDTSVLRTLRVELCQFYAMLFQFEKAAALATDENLVDASPVEKAQLYTMLSHGLADAKDMNNAVSFLSKGLIALKEYRALARETNLTTSGEQRVKIEAQQNQFFIRQFAELAALVLWKMNAAGKTKAHAAILEEVRAALADDKMWIETDKNIRALMQQIEKDNENLNKPATPWAEHTWIGSEPLSLEQLKGKVVLMDFFATWCKPCIMAFAHLKEWKERYGEKGFVIVGLTNYQGRYEGKFIGAEEEFEKLKNDFIPKHLLTWAVGVEAGRKTFADYGVQGIPHVVLVDRKGNVRYFKTGAGDYDETERMIQRLLAE